MKCQEKIKSTSLLMYVFLQQQNSKGLSCCVVLLVLRWYYSCSCIDVPPVNESPTGILDFAVRRMVLETERLVESRRLLEAHAHLMDLEQWQDEILWQLCGEAGVEKNALGPEDQEVVARYFSGVGTLVDALGKISSSVVSYHYIISF